MDGITNAVDTGKLNIILTPTAWVDSMTTVHVYGNTTGTTVTNPSGNGLQFYKADTNQTSCSFSVDALNKYAHNRVFIKVEGANQVNASVSYKDADGNIMVKTLISMGSHSLGDAVYIENLVHVNIGTVLQGWGRISLLYVEAWN